MTWLFDSRRFAKKVKNPSGLGSFSRSGFEDNGKSTSCPSCGQEITPGTYVQEWPGLPAGVKFDPGDKELLDHLAAKVGHSSHKLHPLIDEFIPTLDSEDGICYTHPEKLPGIKRDGSSSHFFHKPSNAYTKGTRKRRKVQTGDEAGETRWHKTGKTRPVTEGGKQIGCKKIMVLYTNFKKNNKPEKTNWVMHQYHLGTQEEEKEGELVVSKVFYQTQPRSSTTRKSNAFDEEEVHDEVVEEQLHEDPGHSNVEEVTTSTLTKVLPITPQAYTPFRPWSSRTRLPIIPHSRLDIQEQNIPVSDSTLTAYINSSQKVQVNTNIVQGELDDMSSFVSHKTTHPNPEVITCAQVNQTLSNHDVEVTGGENMETPSAQYSDAAVELQVDDMIASSVHLLCDEKLHCDLDLLDTAFDQDFRNFASELGLTIDEESDDIARDATASALDNIFLDTPPEMLEDPFISSQELLDWIGRKKINLRAEPIACLETFADSQSST